MSRIENILANIRNDVSDEKETRWSDADILLKINQAVLDFVGKTKILKDTALIELETNQNFYDISDIALDILRVQYLNKTVHAITEQQLASLDPYWEDTVSSSFTHVVFEDLKKGSFKIYPKVEDLTLNIFEQNQPYGILIDITTDINVYSLIEDATGIDKFMTVYYVKRPSIIEIDTLDEDIPLPEEYDKAIIFYTTGMLLRGDSDAQNRSFSAEQLQLYGNEVISASGTSSSNNNSVNSRQTSYNGGF
jgi:hypothetical protein